MFQKLRLICGFLVIIGFVSLLSIFMALPEIKNTNEEINLFDMSLEELMEMEVTVISHKEKKAALIPLTQHWS